MTYSTKIRNLATTTALAGLLAAPLAAQTADIGADVNGDADIAASELSGSVNGDVGTDLQGDSESNAEAELSADAAVDADLTDQYDLNAETNQQATLDAEALTRSEQAIAAGEAVAVSADGNVIGSIEAMKEVDGVLRYSVALEDDFAVGSERAAIQSEKALTADGELEVDLTDEEFAALLSHQTGVTGDADSQVN
ncbi:hypothetical protein ACFSUD_15755 [Sulfitobacter aestuarii]|uniref:PRC-barrel domain-containing protein n=1 Tax=Sulfitobacter aestuarii TaxID=2161676 RepID=A0ABW5U878_9RHOB